ncbi:hemin uptake protein HemP [Maritimibacter sp. 55A14]|uniref:hemin uptake protein HemP n=1 Tax=Maritimibacter sp. 55A14 TaxID=2174844 RepID=UPI000D6035E3|nr:hemin uptake protein HemP [Maritimibacter sp. 55A14]
MACQTTARNSPSAAGGPPVHDARELVAGGACARIVLDGQEYTLRITRAGKLILTK